MKKIFTLLFILFLYSFICNIQKVNAQSSYLLSDKTINQYDIIIYDTSSVIQKEAANELQHYLAKIFREEPGITKKENSTKERHFLLGLGFINDSLFSTDTISKYALIQCVENGSIYLAGYDPQINSIKEHFVKAADTAIFGTLYSTYDWLENQLGVHWFFPTNLGEYVPESRSIRLTNNISIIEPAFTERTFRAISFYHNTDTLMDWMIRNKVNDSRSRTYNHNWKNVVPEKKYYVDNPEYFAEIGGERKNFTNTSKQAQLCTSNSNLVNQYVKNAIQYLDTNPQFHSFSLSPNDNRHYCECIDCKNLDEKQDFNQRLSSKSNRIFTFYANVSDSLLYYYPDYTFGGFAYTEYTFPPKNIDLADNFHVRLAINNYGFGNSNCSTIDSLKYIINTWGKAHNNLGFYSFPYANKWVYPVLQTKTHKEILKSLNNSNFHSVRLAFYPEWFTQGLDIWLISKMYWNVEINTDSLKQIYYNSIYPSAKRIIKSFHSSLNNKFDSLSICIPEYSFVNKEIPDIFLEVFDRKNLEEIQFKLKTLILKNNTLNKKEKLNIENFNLSIEFLLLEYKSYYNKKNFNEVPGLDDKRKFEIILNKMRNSLCITNQSVYFDEVKSPSLYIKTFAFQFN